MKPTSWRLPAAAVAALVTWPAVADAHSPIKGLGTFYSYMLHPLVVPTHALLLIAVALLLGQQGREAAGRGLITLAVGFAAGLAFASAGVVAGVRQPVLLVGSLIVGGTVSLGSRITSLASLAVAGLAGVALGLDSAPDISALREAMLAYAGLMTGLFYLAAVIAGLTAGVAEHWQRVGVRIAGSWIVAASALVLALTIAGPPKHAAASGYATEEARQC